MTVWSDHGSVWLNTRLGLSMCIGTESAQNMGATMKAMSTHSEMSGDLPGKRALHINQLVHVCVGETKGWNYRRTEHSDSKCCADLLGVPN